MVFQNVTLTNPLGLHTRTSAALVKCASKFIAHIELRVNDQVVDAKRVLAVLGLGCACGDVLTVSAEGEDEQAALAAMVQTMAHDFSMLDAS